MPALPKTIQSLTRNALLTGSRVYGLPGPCSDIDLVVLMSLQEAEKLADMMDSKESQNQISVGAACAYQWKFGLLNLLVMTDKRDFDVWIRETEELVTRKPVTRDEAISTFKRLRKEVSRAGH